MRYSRYFIPTTKQTPSDAEVVSHQLMMRAGMIRKLASGIYTYLPAGLKALKKVERIVREEMERAGAVEILMPAVQPGELWQESGRWDYYGKELLRFKDRHERDCCMGPTHEEVVTDLVRREIRSYKQLPVTLFQIQTKFRDEIRPRFGLMRAREFIMKDAYSFDADEAGANRSYEAMVEAYTRIFQRCGLRFRAVEADTGTIGGSFSHEFMVLADTGEDTIMHCTQCTYAANLERAEVITGPAGEALGAVPLPAMERVPTPGKRTVEEVCAFLAITPRELLKTLILKADGTFVAVLLRGDHDLNEAKVRRFLGADVLELASPAEVEKITGAPVGFAGPVGLQVRVLGDAAMEDMPLAVVGGNQEDVHFRNVRPGRDFVLDQTADLRVITPEDPCPRCGAEIRFCRGIEVGHVFKLGTKYSKALKAVYLDDRGEETHVVMGCYGIGVGRTLAAAIEQNHDKDGIVFPIAMAPFELTLLPLQMHDAHVASAAEKLYGELLAAGVDVLLDDRDERAGVKFKDADLLGIPVRLTIGTRGVKDGQVEMTIRGTSETRVIPLGSAAEVIHTTVRALYDSHQ